MTNEWAEFKAYTGKPIYTSTGKRDFSYLGRFSFKTLTEFEGLGRILTVLARGYLFHNADGSLKDGDLYTRIDYAKNAICAWCSVPEKSENSTVNFGNLSSAFPDLVNKKGEGWLYTHIKNIVKFAKANPDLLSEKSKETVSAILKGFTKEWKKKVKQMQIPPFSLNTKGAWVLKFDDFIADALEQGALLTEEYTLPTQTEESLKNIALNSVPFNVISDVVRFYLANRREDTEWVQLPVANFDCYYGNTNFSKKHLSKIPKTILERETVLGVCRVKLNIYQKSTFAI